LFQLGLLALKDSHDEFFRLLPKAMESKKLKWEELTTWPIFRNIRKLTEFATFQETHKMDYEKVN